MRTRVLVNVVVGPEEAMGYDQGTGFYEDLGHPTLGIDINSVLPDKILNVKGDIVEPKVRPVTDFDFVREDNILLGDNCMLDFDNLAVNNYTPGSGPYKRLYVRAYGVVVAPGWGEQASMWPLTHGSFMVELEFTSISGAEG
jgi:hypothetical protein